MSKKQNTTKTRSSSKPVTTARVGADGKTGEPASKIDTVIAMLRTKDGASIDEVARITGWQAHSVRGAISGQLRRKQGLNVLSEKVDGVRRYRIAR
jgi:hypothetical protein